MREILDGLGEILQHVRDMLAGTGQLEGTTGACVLALINDSIDMCAEIEDEDMELGAEVAWLRRRFFAAGVNLEDLTPGYQYSVAGRITRRPVLAVVSP